MVIMDTSEKYIKKCESAEDIQRKWVFKSGDFVFDPDFEEVQVLLWYPTKDYSEYVWLPRQDQLQELCINFYMQNLSISRYEAFCRFLEWYAGCLKATSDNGLNVGKNEIDSGEELLLEYTMNMLHWKKWNGENWVRKYDGHVSKNAR